MNTRGIDGYFIKSLTNDAAGTKNRAADDSFVKKLEAAVRNNDDKELKKACQEFESIMLSILYKQMKATIIKSDFIDKDAGTEIFESMQDENLMGLASKTGGFGLAESLYKQLSRTSGTGVKNVDKEIIQENEPVEKENGE